MDIPQMKLCNLGLKKRLNWADVLLEMKNLLINALSVVISGKKENHGNKAITN
jgi:hypothetical protein